LVLLRAQATFNRYMYIISVTAAHDTETKTGCGQYTATNEHSNIGAK
jgi:hypothetical protein